MDNKPIIFIFGLVFLSSVQPAPSLIEEQPKNKIEENEIDDTNNAFSKSNASYSTFEEIMEEIAARKAAEMNKHVINKR